MRSRQQSLFPYVNPLVERLGADFFRKLPRTPGVYLMRAEDGGLLYVGKAKNLRARLNSYKCARPKAAGRKVMRMLRLTRSVEVRETPTETDAFLAENALLREFRPPFNVTNTRPEIYYFVTLTPCRRPDPGPLAGLLGMTDPEEESPEDVPHPGRVRLRLCLTTNPAPQESHSRMFGVFRARVRTRDSFHSLLRLLSALDARTEHFCFPTALVKDHPPPQYTLFVPEELAAQLRDFLDGRSRAFLAELVAALLANARIPRFVHGILTEDLKQLEEFYRLELRRVRAIKRLRGIRRRVIAQDEIDDLLVRWAAGALARDGERARPVRDGEPAAPARVRETEAPARG